MNAVPPATPAEDVRRDEEIAAALDAALDALQKGQALDRQALLAQHPQLHGALDALDQLVANQATRIDTTTPSASTAAPQQIGPYRIERPLGSGGFGVVYLAHDLDLKRRVAVKMLHPERVEQPEMVQRFQREACAIARLQHPGIVQLYEYSRSGPPYYLVTEFIEGVEPRQWCRQQGCGPRDIADLLARIAETIDHAHGHGVCHRDLKPGNLLIDAEGRPHILDFGLARLVDAAADASAPTVDGQVLGSLAYMAPEQAAGDSHHADARSDVYALGVILYELLTGQLPFQGPAHSMAARIVEDHPPLPRSIQPTLPADLEAICLKALAKRPDDRYPSAVALARDLRAFLRGEPIEAHRWTWLSYVQRGLQRRHHDTRSQGWNLLLLLLGVTILIGCAIANYWEYHLPPGKRWLPVGLTKLAQIGVMLLLVVRYRPNKNQPLTVLERQIWSLIPGYYGGYLTLVLMNGLLEKPLPLGPILAVLSGLEFATLGATVWGWFYVWGAFFFGLALLIALVPDYGLTLLGLGWFVCLGMGALHMRWTR